MILESLTNAQKHFLVLLTRIRGHERTCLILEPTITPQGFSVRFEEAITFNEGDTLLTEFIFYDGEKPHFRQLPLRIGGVMRCCLETLNTTPVIENEGDVLPCRYCKSQLRVRDGAWEWDQEAYPKEESCS